MFRKQHNNSGRQRNNAKQGFCMSAEAHSAKDRHLSADRVEAVTSFSIKTECLDLHAIGFNGQVTPLTLMCRLRHTSVQIVY